jgi:hypothetical protein
MYSEDAGFSARHVLKLALDNRDLVPSDGLCLFHAFMVEYTGSHSLPTALALRAIVHKLLSHPQAQQLYGFYCIGDNWEHFMEELAQDPKYNESGSISQVPWADTLVREVLIDMTNRPLVILERPELQTEFIFTDEHVYELVELAALGLRPIVLSFEADVHYNRVVTPQCFASAQTRSGCSPLSGKLGCVVGFNVLCFAS